MNKNLTIVILLALLACGVYLSTQVNKSPTPASTGGGITGGFDACFGSALCEGKKAVLEAEATRILWTPIPPTPAPTINPAKVEFETGVYDTGSEVAPVLGWGTIGLLLLLGAITVLGFAWWLFFVWLPNQKKKPVAGISGKLLSLEFQDGGKLLGDANTVGATHWQQGTDKPIALLVDPEVAISADANAAFRDASLVVGKMITRNQLFNNAASQMRNLLGTTFDGVANVRAAGEKPEKDSKKNKEDDPPIITIK